MGKIDNNITDVIVTTSLTKNFGSKCVLNSVSLNVPKGSVFGLIGRNGAGKTTFMKILLGFINESSGEMEILGEKEDFSKVRGKIGSIIETPTFDEDMSAYHNLKFRGLLIGFDDDNVINDVLKKVGLYEDRNKHVKHYSLGMKQRFGIASAILGNPEILLLDEPINGLDPVAIKQVREILEDLSKKGVTIFISSHILGEMEKIATHYAFINEGTIIKQISTEELANSKEDLETYFIKLIGGNANE